MKGVKVAHVKPRLSFTCRPHITADDFAQALGQLATQSRSQSLHYPCPEKGAGQGN